VLLISLLATLLIKQLHIRPRMPSVDTGKRQTCSGECCHTWHIRIVWVCGVQLDAPFIEWGLLKHFVRHLSY